MAGGKAAAEAGAVTHGAVRCSAWLGVSGRLGFASDILLEAAWHSADACAAVEVATLPEVKRPAAGTCEPKVSDVRVEDELGEDVPAPPLCALATVGVIGWRVGNVECCKSWSNCSSANAELGMAVSDGLPRCLVETLGLVTRKIEVLGLGDKPSRHKAASDEMVAWVAK